MTRWLVIGHRQVPSLSVALLSVYPCQVQIQHRLSDKTRLFFCETFGFLIEHDPSNLPHSANEEQPANCLKPHGHLLALRIWSFTILESVVLSPGWGWGEREVCAWSSRTILFPQGAQNSGVILRGIYGNTICDKLELAGREKEPCGVKIKQREDR